MNIAIIDLELGNLFSVKHACDYVGLRAFITNKWCEVGKADAVILPGVGAFGNAMATLKRLDLIKPLRDFYANGKPMIGICLGYQLFMTESEEFGFHEGLGLLKGRVVPFDKPIQDDLILKVPHIGWNKIFSKSNIADQGACWSKSILKGVMENEYMYFVHTYYVQPDDSTITLSWSRYGQYEFSSSVSYKNIFACQFHPERSGQKGLKIYHNLARMLNESTAYNNK